MRPTIRGLLLTVALASIAQAVPLCLPGTMADYMTPAFVAQGGCQISDKIFSGFGYLGTANGNGVAVAAGNVNVIPDFTDPLNPGFHFASTKWTVSANALDPFNSYVDSTISFNVNVVNGVALMDDGTLTLDSFGTTGPAGASFGDVAETITPNGQAGIQLQVDTDGPFSSHKVFALTNGVSVLKDLIVFAPGGTTSASSATINQFSENFSELGAPEPVSFLLFGSGLLGMGLVRRRRR